MPWYLKIWHQIWTVGTTRYAYYIVWTFIDSGMIFCGLAYNYPDKEGNIMFDRYSNINIWEVETGHYLKKMTSYWNITIQVWMKKYVFMRIISKGEKPPVWKFFVVFLVSAFWHGFYPSYYFFFLFFAIHIFISGEVKIFYSYYLRNIPWSIQIFFAYLFTTWMNIYFGNSFMMFFPNDLVTHYNCQYWYGHIVLITLFIISLSPIGAGLKKHAAKMKKQLNAEINTEKKNK